MQTLKELREKIQTLETQRAQLLAEIESLRKAAETRATTLENELAQMREDAKALREMLSPSQKGNTVPPSIQKVQNPPVVT